MVPAEANDPPSVQRQTPQETARTLRAHFTRHNLRVVGVAFGTLLATAALWAILHGVCCWLIVLAFSAVDLPDARVPRGFDLLFVVTAFCAVIYAWIDHRLTPNEQARDDKKVGEILIDIVLAIPRMTLAIGGTLAAWQRLSEDDLVQAAALLHRLAEATRLPMSGVRLEIPDPAAALRILFALQITQIIDVQRESQEFWLKLSPLRPAALRLTRATYADA
jgi:hypothetical protein